MKVAIIGAGNVGAMVASRLIDANLADVVLMDIVPGLAKGKALDISDARSIFDSRAAIIGTEDFKDIELSNILVITAGFARKPGMSRDDLLNKNASILKEIASQIKKYCPSSIVIVVTNPLDEMSYLVLKTTGFEPSKVIGMAGVLDSTRFINIASQRVDFVDNDKIFIMGSHGDTMVPINRTENLCKDIFKEVSERTRLRGGEIVSYLKTGSAFFAPSAAVFYMLKIILKNERKTVCASAYLRGEFGENDIYIGIPVVLGHSGIEKVIEIELTVQERENFKKSAQKIREGIKKICPLNMI